MPYIIKQISTFINEERQINYRQTLNKKAQEYPVLFILKILIYYLFIIDLSIESAAFLPAPIARITVAAPVTASPPA